MMQLKKWAVTVLLASGTLLMGHAALAATVTQSSSFKVSLDVTSLCVLGTADDVDFGNVDSATPTTVIDALLSITCNEDTPYSIALKPSNDNANGQGQMTGGVTGATISYGLYKGVGGSFPWGSTVGTNTVDGIGDGTPQSMTVFVKVMGTEFNNKPADHYTDTVAVVLTY